MGLSGGVLVVDKPAGPTSFEVVKRVRRALGAEKAGHAGTLDPAATGVLAVCVGDAVKLQQWLSDGDKAYDALVAFGAAAATDDAEGAVTARGDAAAVSAEAIRAALPALTGEIEQIPPMYSAVRVAGHRLHEAARAGEEVDRAPRKVRVDALELASFEPAGADGLARAGLRVRCGKGTYVRTLAADLGRALGVPAHLAALRRTMASGFPIAQAIPLAEVERVAHEDAAVDPRVQRERRHPRLPRGEHKVVRPRQADVVVPVRPVLDRAERRAGDGQPAAASHALDADVAHGEPLRRLGRRGDGLCRRLQRPRLLRTPRHPDQKQDNRTTQPPH